MPEESAARSLTGRVALVTGASRGVGRGIALGLGEAGATVYVTGRTVEEGASASRLPGTVQATATQVSELGGLGSRSGVTPAMTTRSQP